LTIEHIMINSNHSFLLEIVKTFLTLNISDASTLILVVVSQFIDFLHTERTKIEGSFLRILADRHQSGLAVDTESLISSKHLGCFSQ
jgi:hypothetical protein